MEGKKDRAAFLLKRRLNSVNVTIAINRNAIEVFPNVGSDRNMKFSERLKAYRDNLARFDVTREKDVGARVNPKQRM